MDDYIYLKYWYWKPKVKFKIIQYTMNRAMDFIASKNAVSEKITTRSRRCHNVQHFDYILRNLHCFWKGKIYNMYYSMATYRDGIPFEVSTFNLKDRDTQAWNENHHRLMKSFDFYLDIDAPDHSSTQEAWIATKEICQVLDKYEVPYYLRFSGKGFHIVSPQTLDHFSFNEVHDNNIYRQYRKIAKYFYDNYSQMIDLSIYDSRRVLKIPYTLAIYPDATFVCCPINPNDKFSLTDFMFNIESEKLLDREDFLYNSQGSLKELKRFVEYETATKTKNDKKKKNTAK